MASPILNTISTLIGGSVTDGVAKIISLFKVDPNLALQKQVELQEIQMQMQRDLMAQVTAQIEVNKAEASNPNLFVSGWRPYIGWVCGMACATQFVIAPLATWIAALFGKIVVFPSLDMGTLMTLLLGMLGLGGMRTYEKVNGINSGH